MVTPLREMALAFIAINVGSLSRSTVQLKCNGTHA